MATFAVFNGANVIIHKNFEVLPDRYISVDGGEATPIEDFGDYLLTSEDLTEDQALESFMQYLGSVHY